MLNIGYRPTLDNGKERSIEVHIFDFDHDIYGQSLRLELMHFVRPERKFSSIDELKHQLADDEITIREFFKQN